jgi:hypothetical protein
MAPHPKANSLIQNLPNKMEHVLPKTQRLQRCCQSVKPGEMFVLTLLFTGRISGKKNSFLL